MGQIKNIKLHIVTDIKIKITVNMKNQETSIGQRLLNISKGKHTSNTIVNNIHKHLDDDEEQEKKQPNFPMKTHREPKVIVFQEPGKKTSRAVSSKRKRPSGDDGDDSTVIGDKESFLNIAREVKTFGVTGFDKKFQKRDAQKYAEHLGAAKKKNEKVPYPILMAQKKRTKEK